MSNLISRLSIGLALLCSTSLTLASVEQPAKDPSTDELFAVISSLDSAVFDAFNNCSAPEQLEKHAGFFSPDVEFYHDTGGVTWNRKDMIANTAKNACGNYRRELVAGSLKVFPIKGFGAIAQGTHRFCQVKTDSCEGMADFAIIWRSQDTGWTITRVLSYGHRPNAEALE
ncbi:MAG: DUF4440 domain-containing protein [Gammaproteobacteria bacterium RIFCSPHIGHO2_12_FULL_63_22]|nr:MAG: DUF4440 domain-containing protein [Gammaproteobacteria bacterium RIFCSPHIGHO2_12_FULL_63_22]